MSRIIAIVVTRTNPEKMNVQMGSTIIQFGCGKTVGFHLQVLRKRSYVTLLTQTLTLKYMIRAAMSTPIL